MYLCFDFSLLPSLFLPCGSPGEAVWARLRIPAHPHAGLAGVGGGQLGGRLPGASLRRQHLGCLAADVVVQLDELVQVHDARRIHRSSLLVDLGKYSFRAKHISFLVNIRNEHTETNKSCIVFLVTPQTGLFCPPGSRRGHRTRRSHLGAEDSDGHLPQGRGVGSRLHLKQQVLLLPGSEPGGAETEKSSLATRTQRLLQKHTRTYMSLSSATRARNSS